jgi:hypothetical protein
VVLAAPLEGLLEQVAAILFLVLLPQQAGVVAAEMLQEQVSRVALVEVLPEMALLVLAHQVKATMADQDLTVTHTTAVEAVELEVSGFRKQFQQHLPDRVVQVFLSGLQV